MNILFRCDSSIAIGLGHLSRCLALSRYIYANYDVNIFFAMRSYDFYLSKIDKFIKVVKYKGENSKYIPWFESCLNSFKINILILDIRNDLNKENLKKIKKNNEIKIITIDDPEEKRLECDIAFYPPVYQTKIMNWEGSNAKVYIGFKYFILREEFENSFRKKVKNKSPRVLISLGGSDPENHTSIFLESLLSLKFKGNIKIVVLLGPGFIYHDEIYDYIQRNNLEIEVISNPSNVISIFKTIDLGIISFGVTAYELAALDVPALYFAEQMTIKYHQNYLLRKILVKYLQSGIIFKITF